jgi:hypothetical protein
MFPIVAFFFNLPGIYKARLEPAPSSLIIL